MLKFSVSTSLVATGKFPGKMIMEEAEEERQEGMKEKSYKRETESLRLAEGCDFKTERGEEWNVKVGEQ